MIALAATGWFLSRGLSGESGGARSPEAAVRAMAASINEEDATGVIGGLNPAEVRSASDLLHTLESRAQGTGLAGPGNPYSGFDVQIDDLELSVEELSETTARVDIDDGEASWSLERTGLGERMRKLPGEERYSGEIERDDLVATVTSTNWYDGEEDVDEVEIEPFVITTKVGDGWYVSPFLTAAAWVAEAADLPDGDFDEDPADGLDAAESPEEAVVALVNSLEELDPEQTHEALPSDEFALLTIYRDSLEELLERELSEGTTFGLEVDDEDLVVDELPSGYRRVSIEQASGTFETFDEDGYEESYDWELDGLCLSWDGPDESDERCLDDNDDYDTLLDELGVEAPFVVVEPDRGGWVVSPVATLIQYGVELVPKISDAWMFRLVGLERIAPPDATAEVGTPVAGSLNEAGYTVIEVELAEEQQVALAGLDDDLWTSMYDPDLNQLWGSRYGDPVEEAGTYTIVVRGPANEDFELTIAPVDVIDMPPDGVAVGTVSPESPVVEHRFTVPELAYYAFDHSDDESYYVEVYDSDHDVMSCSYEPCTLEPDEEYRLRISLPSDDGSAVDYEVAVVQAPPVSIDGSTSVTSFVGESSTSYHVVHVSSDVTATIEMVGDSSADLDLYCSPSSACTPSTSFGSTESISIVGPFDGEIYVESYHGSGDYQIVISASG